MQGITMCRCNGVQDRLKSNTALGNNVSSECLLILTNDKNMRMNTANGKSRIANREQSWMFILGILMSMA